MNFLLLCTYFQETHYGAVWMLPARQHPQAFDFDRLGLRLIAWQASPGQGAIQTNPITLLGQSQCTVS